MEFKPEDYLRAEQASKMEKEEFIKKKLRDIEKTKNSSIKRSEGELLALQFDAEVYNYSILNHAIPVSETLELTRKYKEALEQAHSNYEKEHPITYSGGLKFGKMGFEFSKKSGK